MPMRDPRKRRAEAGDTADALARFRDGDADAFEEVVGQYHRRLVQFYFRLCWDRDRAEDFTQELFMKLLRGARAYRPEGKLSTFIFRVATNLWIDHYRSIRPHPRLYSLDRATHADERPLGAMTPGTDVEPIDRVIHDEEKARLRQALEALTEPHRLVFELAVYQEMPYAEISNVLGIPVGTVKSRMHNSVHALREILMPAPDTDRDDDRCFRSGEGAG